MSLNNDEFVLLGSDDIRDFNEDLLLPESPASCQQILDWLQPTNYDDEGGEYRKHLAAHVPGTSEWLTATHEWRQWRQQNDQGLLWIKGIPGSGKSVVAAHFIKDLSKDALVLFFFFRQIIDANHSPQALLRDWLAQLLTYSPHIQAELSQYVKTERDLASVSMDDLWRLLRIGLAQQRQVYVVADALDEMDSGNEGFIQELAKLGAWKPSTVKVLVTSRPTPAMENALRNTTAVPIRLDEKLVDVDIATYVSHCLSSTSISPVDRDLIRQAVPGNANGLFLYARLAMDRFLEPQSDIRQALNALPKNLGSMFTDLLFTHAERSGVPLSFQLEVLQWVTHASRPLRLLELSEIISASTGEKRGQGLKDTKALVRASCGPLIEVLPDETLSVIHHSLTEFLKGWTRIPAAAPEEQAIFPILEPGTTHAALANACLRYLHLDSNYESAQTERLGPHRTRFTRKQEVDLFTENPFAHYAASNWHVHVSKALAGLVSNEDAEQMYQHVDHLHQIAQEQQILQQLAFPSLNLTDASKIHVAAWAGLPGYAIRTLDSGDSAVDDRDDKEQSALHLAAKLGHTAVARCLMNRGANINAEEVGGLRPLHLAAVGNNAGIIKLLLEAGVDPMTQKTKEKPGRRCGNSLRTIGQTAWMLACQDGHAEVVGAFIPYLSSQSLTDALAYAATAGKTAVIQKLLQEPRTQVNAVFDDDSALFLACRGHHYEAIRILLRAGANPNQLCVNAPSRFRRSSGKRPDAIVDGRGLTPLHALCGVSGHSSPSRGVHEDGVSALETALKSMLQAGGDVAAQDSAGNSPLHFVCKNAFNLPTECVLAVIRVLLEAGADPNAANDVGQTPLHKYSQDHDGEILRVLVQQGGANVNQKDADGLTPLIRLLFGGRSGNCYNSKSMLNIMQYNPDYDVTDMDGNTPLHLAFQNRNPWPSQFHSPFKSQEQENAVDDVDEDLDVKIVTALLANGAKANARNTRGQTPLHVMKFLNQPRVHGKPHTYEVDKKLISLMTEAGADLEARDAEGQTVLFARLGDGDEKVQVWLDAGCSLDVKDHLGRSPLHEILKCQANGRGYGTSFELLTAHGLDKAAIDYAGNTLFHEIAASKTQDRPFHVSQSILPAVSPDRPNDVGQTPLHIASNCSHAAIFQGLLELCSDIDATDKDLVTPLHVAAGCSESKFFKLLHAGAAISSVTREGQTVLHLASKSQQMNIIGLVCQTVSESDPSTAKSFINAVDKQGQTALHYACLSGRPEAVEILLQHGADPNLKNKLGTTPLSICAGFDAQVRGPSLKDNNLQRQTINASEEHTARIEEVLDLLVAYGADVSLNVSSDLSVLEDALQRACDSALEYPYSCFSNLGKRLGLSDIPHKPSFHSRWAEHREASASKAFDECPKKLHSGNTESFISGLLFARQYGLIRKIIRNADPAVLKICKALFVKRGYSALLEEVLQYARPTPNLNSMSLEDAAPSESLIHSACCRNMPNRAVLKVLLNHDPQLVDERGIERNRNGPHRSGTALHQLAKAMHWWMAHQGIPYFLSAGADVNARNGNGETPLHVALRHGGDYRLEALRLLIEGGANVNAVAPRGESCLTMARDKEAVSLLLEYGAERSPSVLFAAIKEAKPELVELLLQRGLDPNGRMEHLEAKPDGDAQEDVASLSWISALWSGGERLKPDQLFPLHYALSSRLLGRTRSRFSKPDSKDFEVVRILLRYGADPSRKFEGLAPAVRDLQWFSSSQYGGNGAYLQTIAHAIAYEESLIEVLLDQPGVDIECRDERGRTLFLAACCSYGNFDRTRPLGWGAKYLPQDDDRTLVAEQMLGRGADVRARDNAGNNALHLSMASVKTDLLRKRLITQLVRDAPELISEKNHQGETPWHFALRTGTLDIIEAMLDAGADARVPDSDGNFALHHIASLNEAFEITFDAPNQASRILQRVLALDIDINSRNQQGETMLFRAMKAWTGSIRVVQQPKPQDLPLSAEESPDFSSVTAWVRHLAQLNRPAVACLPLEIKKLSLGNLCAAGADVFTCNELGDTLLHVVAAANPVEDQIEGEAAQMFQSLIDLGLDPLAENHRHRSALDIASVHGNGGILALFEKKK